MLNVELGTRPSILPLGKNSGLGHIPNASEYLKKNNVADMNYNENHFVNKVLFQRNLLRIR